jgi:hypothetical protein
MHTYTHMNTHLWCVHEQQRVASVAHSFVLLPHTGVAARAFATLARAQHLRVGVSRGTFVRVGGCEWNELTAIFFSFSSSSLEDPSILSEHFFRNRKI